MLQTDISGDCWLELLTFPALSIFFMDENKVADILPARLVGSAYTPGRGFEENHIDKPVDIFAVGEDEYLLPTENKWKEEHVIETKLRLDQAKKIEERPIDKETGTPTRKIPEMTLSNDISPEARESLLNVLQQEYVSKPDYKAEFILPEPLPVRFLGGAYERDIREDDTDIFAVGGGEYLVPVEYEWDGDHVSESKVRLDLAKKIEFRPFNDNGKPTRNISEMKLSADISPEVRASLLAETKRRYKNKPKHKAEFVLPEPK